MHRDIGPEGPGFRVLEGPISLPRDDIEEISIITPEKTTAVTRLSHILRMHTCTEKISGYLPGTRVKQGRAGKISGYLPCSTLISFPVHVENRENISPGIASQVCDKLQSTICIPCYDSHHTQTLTTVDVLL